MSTTETEVQGTITPKDFAEMVGSDPKTVRRFLRSVTDQRANKGGRWEIPTEAVEELKARWANRAKGTQLTIKATDGTVDELDAEELEDEVDELEDIDEL